MSDSLPIALELRGVCKRMGAFDILRGVDLVLPAGERLALIGPNGAGKSTLFNVVSGRVRPDRGEVLLRGVPIHGKKPAEISRLGLGRSFQISQLFGDLSVLENLRCSVLWSAGYRYQLFRRLSRMDAVNVRTQALLQMLQLEHKQDVLAQHLSYAEQRALELGITLGSGADVLLLDEPTAGMSRSEALSFVHLMRTLTVGKSVLIVEHDMDVVRELATGMAVLVAGQIVAQGTADAVRANPQVQAAYGGLWQREQSEC